MSELAIQCNGLSKQFPYFSIDNLDLEVEEGSVMGFVGPNGAGKSTTMKMIMGLLGPDSGDISVLGHPMPQQQVAAKWDIGFVTEDMRLYSGRSLGFHMEFIKSIYPSWDDALARQLLKRFDLLPEQKTGGLSHGQRVKACLLLVLARKPRLLILDEPTTGLDPVARQEIIAEMMQILLDDSRSVLFSSHNTQDVEQVSDNISFIFDGRLIASRDKESYLDSWRRVRMETPEGFQSPALGEFSSLDSSGRMAVLTTGSYKESVLGLWQAAGAVVRDVERMTLEEIFLASVAIEKSTGV